MGLVGDETLMDDGGVAMRRLWNGWVVLLLLFVGLAGKVLADTPTPYQVYLPLILRNWFFTPTRTPTVTPIPMPTLTSTPTPPPTPTSTPTPTLTPTTVPTPTRVLLCCREDGQLVLDDDCIIDGLACVSATWLYGGTMIWNDMILLSDIAATTYTFGIAASSYSFTEFRAEIALVQGQNRLILASTSFTANSPEPVRFVSTVEGIDPTVNPGEDKLEVRISHVSGNVGTIYFGVPQRAGAGGSYVEIQFED